MAEAQMKPEIQALKGKKRTLKGVVLSVAGKKTVIVKVEKKVLYPLYKKYYIKWKKYKVHDPEMVCKSGDKVTIVESRPISKEKRWTVLHVNSEKNRNI